MFKNVIIIIFICSRGATRHIARVRDMTQCEPDSKALDKKHSQPPIE